MENIKSGSGGRNGNIIHDIVLPVAEFASCSSIFEERETNVEAHSLAKHALGVNEGRHLCLLQPPDLHCIPTKHCYRLIKGSVFCLKKT